MSIIRLAVNLKHKNDAFFLLIGQGDDFNLIDQKIIHTLETGLVDSSKSVRAILWNSLTLVATIITSD